MRRTVRADDAARGEGEELVFGQDLAAAVGALEELRAELVDRFGRYPAPVETLFLVALVRVRSRRLGLLKVSLKNHIATIVRADKTVTAKGGIDELLDWLKRDA